MERAYKNMARCERLIGIHCYSPAGLWRIW
jgi:hypothetical protein